MIDGFGKETHRSAGETRVRAAGIVAAKGHLLLVAAAGGDERLDTSATLSNGQRTPPVNSAGPFQSGPHNIDYMLSEGPRQAASGVVAEAVAGRGEGWF
ncbi:MAG: hypothetical protein GX575_09990 [Candidatus Anammoximicrobium sp.]|nr:hypothetical protein [Candidatus Anammoximicrobium sp.]